MNIDFKKIKKNLNFECEVELLETVDSTNLYLKRNTTISKDTLVVAKTQTAGKGRHGKNFYSDENGIYMSLLLNKTIPAKNVYLLTVSAAVAVAETLNDLYGINAKIKWVNDVYCANKKLCGILCEGVLNSDGVYEKAIVGIGINIFKAHFPAEIFDIATSLEELVNNPCIDRNNIISSIINRFYDLINHKKHEEIVRRYKDLSLMFGKEITVFSAEGSYTAKVVDIDDNAQLIVQNRNGEIIALNSGEISIKL